MVSMSLEFTSDETIFLYPDCLTALVGRQGSQSSKDTVELD